MSSEQRPDRAPGPPERLGVGGVLARLLGMVTLCVVIGVLVAGLVVPFVGVAGVATDAVAHGVKELPQRLSSEPLPQRTRVLDRRGHLLATFYDQNRVDVALRDVAPVMRRAIVAIEDFRFYQHGALDLQGTLRAFVSNQAGDDSIQGGSSITQQLVKMTLVQQADTDSEQEAATAKTYQRKLQELRYAIAMEKAHSKNWILQRYLNIAYFGDGVYGVEAAAQHYFSRPAADLKVHQAALLAGLVKNPVGYDPTRFPDRAIQRRNVVLNRMEQLHAVSAKKASRARNRGLGLDVRPNRNGCVSSKSPFFCQYVRNYLLDDERLGETEEERARLISSGGLTIRTTIDMRAQRAAERSVRRHVDPTDRAIGALAMIQPGTGKVRAVAQSRPMGKDRKHGETYLDYVVPEMYGDSRGFQAGSTFKVFVLSAAIDQGIPLDTKIKAPQQVRIPVSEFEGCSGPLRSSDIWDPSNSTGSGTFDLYKGTQQSVNTFFAKLELRTGLCQPYRLAKKMGIQLTDPDNQQVPSFTLGVVNTDPLSMAEAYATFAARGKHCDPRPVTRVLDRDGDTITTYPKNCQRVLDKPVADAVTDVLRGVQQPGGFGYNAGISLAQPSAGKTGTIQSNRAVWFVGYTPNMATAAMLAGANQQGGWVTLNGQTVGGNYIAHASGSGNAGPIWGDAMKAIQGWLPDEGFHKPDPTVIKGRTVTVPDVVGMAPAAAAQRLDEVGLSTSFEYRGRDAEEGTVVRTEPAAGAAKASGGTVTVVVRR